LLKQNSKAHFKLKSAGIRAMSWMMKL